MMRNEAKAAMRTTARPSSSWKQSGYAAHGLILGFLIVLLYLMVSAQLSYNNPHGNLFHISIATVCFVLILSSGWHRLEELSI